PRDAHLPDEKTAAGQWQRDRRKQLRAIVRAGDLRTQAEKVSEETKDGVTATFWRLKMDNVWTVPAVEMSKGEPRATAILVGDGGRGALAAETKRLLDAGRR